MVKKLRHSDCIDSIEWTFSNQAKSALPPSISFKIRPYTDFSNQFTKSGKRVIYLLMEATYP